MGGNWDGKRDGWIIMYLVNIQHQQLMMDLEWLWLIIPGGYFLISTFFLCFPCCQHRYRNPALNTLADGKQLLCIGHRGGAFQGPENTLELFRKTDKISHMFELDLNQTLDGHLIVHHDNSLQRTTGVQSRIHELRYEELPSFLPQIQPFGKPGEKITTENNKIITLDQLFKQYPRKLMNIDLKTPTPTAVTQFARVMKEHRRQDVTVWGAATDKGRKQLMEALPGAITFYSTWQVVKIMLLTLSGLLPFWPIRQGVLDIPILTKEMVDLGNRMATTCGKKILVCIAFSLLRLFHLVARLFVPHLRKRGVLTFFWILNSEQDWEKAISIGCRGIMTDSPSLLHEYLIQKQLYFNQSQQQLSYSPVNPQS